MWPRSYSIIVAFEAPRWLLHRLLCAVCADFFFLLVSLCFVPLCSTISQPCFLLFSGRYPSSLVRIYYCLKILWAYNMYAQQVLFSLYYYSHIYACFFVFSRFPACIYFVLLSCSFSGLLVVFMFLPCVSKALLACGHRSLLPVCCDVCVVFVTYVFSYPEAGTSPGWTISTNAGLAGCR